MFVLGLPNNLTDNVFEERHYYNDILVFNFIDTYKNLTLKILSAMRFALKNYNSPFYFKTDDDMFVKLEPIIRITQNKTMLQNKHVLFGHCTSHVLVRRKKTSKFYVSRVNYPRNFYPSYCWGAGYVMSKGALEKIIAISSTIALVPLEDVSMGILANSSGVKVINIPKWLGIKGLQKYKCPKSYITHQYNAEQLIQQFNICKEEKVF